MSGKISGTNSSNQPAAPAAANAAARPAPTAAAPMGGTNGTASSTESVQITDTASHLVSAEQALSNVPMVNNGRVSEVREALASGTYRISPERISNQLLRFERLLPQESAE